jgi:hypothetical protein
VHRCSLECGANTNALFIFRCRPPIAKQSSDFYAGRFQDSATNSSAPRILPLTSMRRSAPRSRMRGRARYREQSFPLSSFYLPFFSGTQ